MKTLYIFVLCTLFYILTFLQMRKLSRKMVTDALGEFATMIENF